ncbi:uncharacterized protein [Lepeophtheirus salmonis]|uniref:uncharacterized protein isoform X1 n=1 Tax=Lepeophtheirus salmonis TaxID=72036 RepID=UPI003AF3D282
MSSSKEAPSLLELALASLSSFIKESTLYYSRRLVRIQNVGCHDLVPVLMKCISIFRHFIFRNVPFTLTSKVASRILIGIEQSIQRRKRFSNPSANNLLNYSKELFCIREFVNLIAVSNLGELNLWNIEESLRTNIVTSLSKFTGLRCLNVGPGSNGDLSSSVIYHNSYLKGLSNLFLLSSLTVEHDCSDLIIIACTNNCSQSLIYLNINYSKYVSDYSVNFIRKCTQLKRLSTFKTGLSPGGKIAILTGLSTSLEYFDNGEFLNFISTNKFPHPFCLKEVFLAENAHKIHAWCPQIKKVVFDHNHSVNFSLLPNYNKLEEIQVMGGILSCPSILPAMESMGKGLLKITLVSMRDMEERLITTFFYHCPRLEDLALINWQGLSHMDTYIPFESNTLKNLSISGDVSSNFLLSFIQLKKLKKLEIGKRIISDKFLLDAIINDKEILRSLREFVIEDPLRFSLGSLYSLIEHLPNIRKLKGLYTWNCLSKIDVINFQRLIRVNNLNVEI